MMDRRTFTLGVGAAGAAALFPKAARAGRKKGGIRVGYAAITWRDTPVKTAIEEISALGYPGIQLRSNILKEFKTPDALKADLEKAKLTFACMSGFGPKEDPAVRKDEVKRFMELATFGKAAGALAIQATSPKRGDKVEKAQLEAFAATLDEIGKRTADIGLPLVFHPHMQQIGEKPEEVAVIMGKVNPKHVRLLLDTGHWQAAGGDPVKAVKQYAKSLAVLHIKDVAAKAPEKPGDKDYVFVELGEGKVDFKKVFAALKTVGFAGWAIVELDSAAKGRAPKEAAAANKVFLEKKIGLSV